MNDIKYILICGAGMMGKNIAFVMASNPAYQVGVYDLYETDVPGGIRANTRQLIAKGALTEEEMRRFNFKQGDSEGFVNYPLSIRGINLSAMFIETHRDIRVSLRSRGDVDVNVFARRYFGGGGHRNAAGGKSFVTMEETIRHFERSVREYFGELPPPATDNGDTDNGNPSQVE